MRFSELTQEELIRLAGELPSKLVIMLYDEAIDWLHAAAAAARRDDIMARCEATTLAAELVSQLRLGLDLEAGGQVAANLDQLYSFIIGRLPRVNFDNDAALADRLAELLEPLRDSWIELDRLIETGAVDPGADIELPGATLAAETLELVASAG